MKRMLIITNLPSPYRVQFFNELAADFDLTVLFAERNEDDEKRDAAWFSSGENRFHAVSLNRRLSLPGGQYLCLDVLDWLKRPFDEIILFGYGLPTFLLAAGWLKLHGKKFSMELDGGLLAPESRAKELLKRAAIGSASQWFSSGKTTDAFLLHYGAKREGLRFYPFSSLRNEDILQALPAASEKEALRRELGMTERHIILAIGQFIPRKGFDVLLKAATFLLPDTGIYFVGGEPTQEYLTLAEHAGSAGIHFVGFRSKQELAKFYRSADVFVLPTREDIWGLVINEAMGYGLPVVTTDRCVAGLELVEDGKNGYLVPIEDAALLAQRINDVLSGDTAAMGRASLEKIRPYTIQSMARVHAKILGGGE